MNHPRSADIPTRTGLALGLTLALALAVPAAAQDGGWTRMLGPQLEKYHQPEVNAVHFFNRHIGWAVGGHARDATSRNQETFIFRTEDGGASWERLTLYDGQEHVPDFVDIAFADANNGWLLSAGALVLRTTDGGRIWEPVEPLPRGGGRTLLVLGPDAVMVGSTSTNGRQINVTTDGGRSWRNSTVTSGGWDNVVDLASVPSGSFFAVVASAMQNKGGVYRSDDGGRNWTAVVEGGQPLHTVAFSPSGRNGVAAGAGVAYATRDGGGSWQRVPASGMRLAAQFLDENTVIAFGSDPALLISGDGGLTWRPGAFPALGRGSSQLVGVQAVDAGWWLVSGGRGAYDLFRYEDPGYGASIAQGSVTLSEPAGDPDGTMCPPGRYDVELVHRGLDHALRLTLREPAEGVEMGTDGALEPGQYALEPCRRDLPIDVEYAKHELAEGEDSRSLFRLWLEPTPSGVALVLEAAATPSRDLAVALAALGAATESEIDANEQVQGASGGGGLFGRVRKAASGDVRGAVEGADPQAASARVQASRAGPVALYRVRLRYALDLLGGQP